MLTFPVVIYIIVCCFEPALSHDHEIDQCVSVIDTPFKVCAKAGYNFTLPFPKEVTNEEIEIASVFLSKMLAKMENCSQNSLAEVMSCSFFAPKCSHGERVHPCKRVCGELLKQCEKHLSESALDYIIALCHILPNNSCFEPPNFQVANQSYPGPLDRGCQELIFPACKNLGLYNQTFMSVKQQKKLYSWFYKTEYKEGDAEKDFPKSVKMFLEKYPKCQENIVKLFCGEVMPPCLTTVGDPGHYSLCQSLCEDILRDCPEFFRNDFLDTEFCSQLPDGKTSHGFCRRQKWPPPFSWLRYIRRRKTKPNQTKPGGTNTWIIVTAVVVPVVVVGILLAVLIWWKWRYIPDVGYKKHTGDDTAPLET